MTILFALSNAFQNDMTWPSSAKNHGGDRFQGKGQGLPHRDWAGVLPTQTFINSNLVTHEIFVQFCPSDQKLFMIFHNTDRQTHKLHTKQFIPLPYMGAGGNFFYPVFVPLIVWINFINELWFMQSDNCKRK